MNSNGYNGYTNYETWAVSLWIDNEENSQQYWAGVAQEMLDLEYRYPVSHLSDALKRAHEREMPEITGVFSDLLNSALSSVNWDEIAQNMLDYVKESE